MQNEVMIQNTCPSNGYVLYWTQSLKFIFKPVCNGEIVSENCFRTARL